MEENYAFLLQDERWKMKRKRILKRDGFTCQLCGLPDEHLHAHHKYYEKGSMPWDYPDEALVTLCEWCHNYIHRVCVQELGGVKVGDIYGMFHSDYHNTGIVYAIESERKLVFILECDDGVSEREMYDNAVSIDYFTKNYRREYSPKDWNYLFPKWFLAHANSQHSPSLFKIAIHDIVRKNATLRKILNGSGYGTSI